LGTKIWRGGKKALFREERVGERGKRPSVTSKKYKKTPTNKNPTNGTKHGGRRTAGGKARSRRKEV